MHQCSIKNEAIFHEIRSQVHSINSYLRFYSGLVEDYNPIALLYYADFIIQESILIIQYESTLLVECVVEGFCSAQSNEYHSNHCWVLNQWKKLNLNHEILLAYQDYFLKV